jgi:hypothetical protein
MIAQQLGLMSTTYGTQNKGQAKLDTSTSKSILQFKKNVGQQKFEQVAQQYDQAYTNWLSRATKDPRWQKMSPDEQHKQIMGEESHLKKTILKGAGYKTIRGKKTTLLSY